MRRWAPVVSVIVLCLSPTSARADGTRNAAVAEALFREGRDFVRAGRWADACPKFAESQRLDPGTGTLLNLAGCYEAIQKYTSAWALYREVQTLAGREGHREREQFAATRSKELEAKFGRITIVVPGTKRDIAVTSDGEPLAEATWGTALPVDPGTHTIVASAAGFTPYRQSVEIAAGGSIKVQIPELSPAPSDGSAVVSPSPPTAVTKPPARVDHAETPSTTRRTLGWVGVGIGGAALIGGGVFGLVAKSKNDAARDEGHCTALDCDKRGVELLDNATTAGNVSTALFIGGAVIAVAGVILVLTAPSSRGADVARRWADGFGKGVF